MDVRRSLFQAVKENLPFEDLLISPDYANLTQEQQNVLEKQRKEDLEKALYQVSHEAEVLRQLVDNLFKAADKGNIRPGKSLSSELEHIKTKEMWVNVFNGKKEATIKRLQESTDLSKVIRTVEVAYMYMAELAIIMKESLSKTPCSNLSNIKTAMNIVNKNRYSPSNIIGIFIDALQTLQKSIYDMLSEIVNLWQKIPLSNDRCQYDLALFLREFDPRYTLSCFSLKITSDGIITDDLMPHNARDRMADGIIKIYSRKNKIPMTLQQISESIFAVGSMYEANVLRLTPQDSGNMIKKYAAEVAITLARMVEKKYISNYVCIKNFITKRLKTLGSEAAFDQRFGSLLPKFEKLFTHDISMCIEKVFSYTPTFAANWIRGNKNQEIMKSETLCKSESVGEFSINIDNEQLWFRVHREMTVTYLANLTYILTHSSANNEGRTTKVTFFRLIKRPEGSFLKTAATFTHNTCVLSRHLNPLPFLIMYTDYGIRHMITSKGDYLVLLKDQNNLNQRAARYLDFKVSGKNRLITVLEACITFLQDLSDRGTIEDLYFAPDAVINNKTIKISPHKPYKYISTRGLQQPREKLLIDVKHNSPHVLGHNDYTYETADNFVDSREFQIGAEKLYMFSVRRSLSRTIESNLGKCIVNYWFAMRLFDMFDNLCPETQVELYHLRGTFTGPKIVQSMFENMGGDVIRHLYDEEKSRYLQEFMVKINSSEYIKKRQVVRPTTRVPDRPALMVGLHSLPR